MHGMHQRKTGAPSDSSSSTLIAPGSSSSPYASLEELNEKFNELEDKLRVCEKTINRKTKKEWHNVGSCSCLKEPYHCCLQDGGPNPFTCCRTNLDANLFKFNFFYQPVVCAAGLCILKSMPAVGLPCMFLGSIAPCAYTKCMQQSVSAFVKAEEEEKLELKKQIEEMKGIFRSIH
jgi:hypothetical protein